MGRENYLKSSEKSPIQQCTPDDSHVPNLNEPIQDGECVCMPNSKSGAQDLRSGDNDDTTPFCYRYAAYANRFRTAVKASIKSASRYLAYTSDVGESFRPVIPRFVVRLGYGVSWAYVITDVSYHTWKAKMRQDGRYKPGLMPWQRAPIPDPNTAAVAAKEERSWHVVAVKEMVFQSLASMGLPAFTIHTIVAHSGFLYKNFRSPNVRKYGPVATGLAVVPFLPFIFDEPVEHAVEWATEKAEEAYEKRHTSIKGE